MDILYRLSPDWSRVLAGSLGGFPGQRAKKQWPCGVVAGILGPIAAILRNSASQRSDSIIREGRLSPEGMQGGLEPAGKAWSCVVPAGGWGLLAPAWSSLGVVWMRCPKRRRGARPTRRTEEEARKKWGRRGRSGRSGRVEMRLQGPSTITFPMPPSAHMAVGSRAAAPRPSATMPLRPESRRHALPPEKKCLGPGGQARRKGAPTMPLWASSLVALSPGPDRAASSEVAKARLQSPTVCWEGNTAITLLPE
jgi:hypothetical protein